MIGSEGVYVLLRAVRCHENEPGVASSACADGFPLSKDELSGADSLLDLS